MESDYDKKFHEMKKYIPFLERMIKRLESTNSPSGNPRQAQLDKIRSLRDLLMDKKKRMKMENLLKCEQVLVNLYTKVEKGDSFSDTKVYSENSSIPKDNSELETVRNKLKTVAKIRDCAETLPEIARANDVELQYIGSKEPALFQRRPNKSPTHSKEKSSAMQMRNYTKVLVSPDRSPRRWPSSECSSSEKPLFSRRTPHQQNSPQPITKKDKKKSKVKSRKTKNVNITLNVPQERLNSFSTADILPRIMNCEDGDIDIDTLREMRSQILGKLKETGSNDDISNLILQSYKKSKSKHINRKNSKQDVEEGELSDSESEAIECIYGSLSVVDKEKKSLAQVKTIEDKDNQQRKIQISFVINEDKDITENITKQPPIIDHSEFEMFSENESEKSKDIVSIDSDSSPVAKRSSNKKTREAIKPKRKVDGALIVNCTTETDKTTECITMEDDVEEEKDQKVEILDGENVYEAVPSSMVTDHETDNAICVETPDTSKQRPSHNDLENTHNTTAVEQKFIANFYKPIEEQSIGSSDSSNYATNKSLQNKPDNNKKNVSQQVTSTNPENENDSSNKNLTGATLSKTKGDADNGDAALIYDKANSKNDSTSEEKNNNENNTLNTIDISDKDKESTSILKENKTELHCIPLLNEPTIPPKVKADMLSEIDILQALKNEILSESISVPGTEVSTPALHQPKLTKVASVQEVMPKKRISIEKYKEKSSTSTPTQLFIKKRSKAYRDAMNKKQSLKLTEKECERFNFPKRLSLDDDDNDIDCISDDDYLTEDKDESFGLDVIYGDLAPKSPDNEVTNENSTLPVIIPMDPVKNSSCVSSQRDVDMRAPLPTVSPQSVLPPFVPSLGHFNAIPPSPAYNVDKNSSEAHRAELSRTVPDQNRLSSMDPRIRRDDVGNPDRTPRSPYPNVVPNAHSMTPSRAPNMTPTTGVYMPSMLCMTPNARTFEMTPTHQTFELDSSSTRKHVYAPSFSACENRERESSVSKDGPSWDRNTSESRSYRNRWEDSNIPIGGPKWDSRDPRSNSFQNDGSHTPKYEDSCVPKYDQSSSRLRTEKYHDKRESSSYNVDCPMTPMPSFGWTECPATPGSAFGRQEASNHFSRSECPATPVHIFGRADCSPTPSSGCGRSVEKTSNRSYNRLECPSTPSHPFGRSDCPPTPTHVFGRNECPQTPTHPFGRIETISNSRPDVSNNSQQNYLKDPRLNRRPTEYESSSHSERDSNCSSERGRKDFSYKSQSKRYAGSDILRNYEREKSVGRTDKNYGDRNTYRYDRDRRYKSFGRSTSKDVESNRLYTRNRESRYDGRYSQNYEDIESRQNQRERSISRTSNTKQSTDTTRMRSRAQSVGRISSENLNKDRISFESDTGRNFTINTSIQSTFQDFLPSGKPIQVFEYSSDARRQRAASVGRSLGRGSSVGGMRESSVGCMRSTVPKTSIITSHSRDSRNDKFKRACSVGRDVVNSMRSLEEVKADFEAFRKNLIIKPLSTNDNTSQGKKGFISTQEQKSKQYSPKKNNRDPRIRKEPVEIRSRYKIIRRNDRDHKKTGIVYSNDNIAKGTIMGSGFGVKNYKIPKIKRKEPEPEIIEVKNTKDKKKEEENETAITIEKVVSDKKFTKSSKESIKATEAEPAKSKHLKEIKACSSSDNDTGGRVTRSKKSLDATEFKATLDDDEGIIRPKKNKKAVIYDSDLDSDTEKDIKSTKAVESSLYSSTKKPNDTEKATRLTPAVHKVLHNKPVAEALDSSFGIDDMEIFSENLVSDPVIENINALIADLDNDLDTSKGSNDTFTSKIDKMLEGIDSPEDNSLGDISEIIENDLTETNLQKNIVKIPDSSKNTLQDNDAPACHIVKGLEDASEKVHISKNMSVDKALTKIVPESCQIEQVFSKNLSVDTIASKVNEDIVSTSEIDPLLEAQSKEAQEKSIKMNEDIDMITSEDKSVPDSTIDKSASGKTLPDSTNDLHCELSSDVTSTYDNVKTPNQELNLHSTPQKETFNPMEGLLSILQDKSKIKELLSMLGEQSNLENDKIKKKLEKLREIVSDEEDENENQKDLVVHKENVESKTKEDIEKLQETAKIDQLDDFEKKTNVYKSDNEMVTNITEKVEVMPTQTTKTTESDVVGSNKDNTSNSVTLDIVFDNTLAVNRSPSKTENEKTLNADKKYEKPLNSTSTAMCSESEVIKNRKNEIVIENTADTDKMDDESNGEDNEPLARRITKKIKGKKTVGKLKLTTTKNVNKRTPAKTAVKKRGELQKLQEDIKEMFMSQDILNATGIRMCRLAKMVSEKDSIESGPVVLLEKVKGVQTQEQPSKMRKKPGPKPKNKLLEKESKSPEDDIKINKLKSASKPKPGPKSKTRLENRDPYEFDTDSIADTSTTKESDYESSDSETGSLTSSRSFGSSEVLADIKKKPKKKRRGIGGWQAGIIKPKNRKKKELKQDNKKSESLEVKPLRPITIPDRNCFTDKSYCFQKGVTTYDCRLCVYSGSDIVKHYKQQHPHNEIPLSRMDPKTAELAILQCEQEIFQAVRKLSSDKYTCRFCSKEFANKRMILESFFWHVVSNHTGEFKHLCPECVNVTRCPFTLDIPPPPKDGGQLIGYICKKCNFTQISLENLKTHVLVHHSDEQTEVFSINLAVISNKGMKAMLRRSQLEKPRVLRSLRSNQSAADISDTRDDRSDASESSGQDSECESSQAATQESDVPEAEVCEQKPRIDKIKSKLTFENDEPSDDTSIKIEQDENDINEQNEISQCEDTPNQESACVSRKELQRGNSDVIVDYPHFKLNYTESGSKEYVCCINGNDSHYKTSLLISMKKHIQSKHSEKWDGYCCVCKVIVTLQGVLSDFRDCLSHLLDKHMDDFPVLEQDAERQDMRTVTVSLSASNVPPSSPPPTPASPLPLAVPEISPAIPARVATPPVERTASPSYIAVRPLAELLSRELVKEIQAPLVVETPIALPKIETVVRLGEDKLPQSQQSPSYPTNVEEAPQSERPFLYEDVQAEVMSKKHRVVLDAMMTKENLVRVFKCAGRFCSFTTDVVDDALLHATAHQRVGGEGALDCAYCNYDAVNNGIDLVMHVFKDHSRCQYCCPLCFYRAAASQLVEVHYKKAHSGAAPLKNVLRSTASITSVGPSFSSNLLTRFVAVQHFVCSHDKGTCIFKTYTHRKFIEHLQQKHPNATSHPCNLCPTAPPTPVDLVVHLRSHGLKLYQCTWCVHGSNTEVELLAHVAARHPDRQPQAYVRVITQGKDGSMRVLPLANLNKSTVPTEEVVPNTTKENPVKEAERSIDLEKLIGHTMMMIEAAASQSTSEDPTEKPVEVLAENLPEEVRDDNNETTGLDSLLTTVIPSKDDQESMKQSTGKSVTIDSQSTAVIVKNEPAEVPRNIQISEVICLDSDVESDIETEDAPVTTTDDPSKSNVNEEVAAKKISTDVSSNSVTDDISITKITEEDPKKTVEETKQNAANKQVQSIIDLSEDESTSLSTPKLPNTSVSSNKQDQIPEIPDKTGLYKCPWCFQICKSAVVLRSHVKGPCDGPQQSDIKCPHGSCGTIVSNITKLIAHYVKVHMELKQKTYCGVCNTSFPTQAGAKLHIRSIHKVTNYYTSVVMDENGYNIINVRDVADKPVEPTRVSGRKTSTEMQRYQAEPAVSRPRKTSIELKKRYGIEDIDKLPISPILDTPVYCDLCEFGTKVKLNMVRHLQQHAEKVPVPRTAPVNPVPHLETNEMHFDRMVNLASSSVANRAPDKLRQDEPTVTLKIPPLESSRYPKYVPERVRYTCGAKACSYISVDMAMFRCHWETLHAREEEYRCVHCPPNQTLDTSIPLTAARILAHLRMHDVSLYACSICTYYHYRKHCVEKHLSDVHKDGSVRVVREEYQPEPATPVPAVGAPTMDLKPWQCGLCDFSSMLRPKVVNHCGSEHQSKMQFKCAYCPFRTSAKENVIKHQTNAHPAKPEDVFYYFYREGSIPDEPDGVPRWQKQRQKLGLNEQVLKTERESTAAESLPATPISITPIAAAVAIDLNIVKEEVLEEPIPSTDVSIDSLCKKFGEFCEPDGIKYKCCLCGAVREHSRDAMQCHLYEELNYRRWECVICSYKAFHKNGLNDHMASEHSRQCNAPRALPTDISIEKWVQGMLDHQTKAIEKNKSNLSIQKIQVERVSLTPAASKTPESVHLVSASDTELENAFGTFGAPKDGLYACPKCEFTTKDERLMVVHLESELSKIRWGCSNCAGKYTTFHEAQFHCRSGHIPPARPKEAIRDPSLRSGWVKAVVATQKQFIKCISETNREPTPERDSEECDTNENSLLVALYDEPVHIQEHALVPAKRTAPTGDSDDERLVIDEPPTKKQNDRNCPYCEYVVNNTRYLREHILKQHYNLKPYKCFYCPFEGSRAGIGTHLDSTHVNLRKRFITVEVPNMLPEEYAKTAKRDTKVAEPAAKPTRDSNTEDIAKKVCLYCEKSVPENEIESHSHGNVKAEFSKRGEVVVKCSKCLSLRLSVTSLQDHFDECHPGEIVLDNYAYFKLQVDKREIYCCGHCYKKFKFLRDLKVHHSASHTSLSLSYTSIPFSHHLHTEGDSETGKRKIEEAAGPSTKRVARKSTSKLSNSAVAKKSTTKLPLVDQQQTEIEEFSYYGTKPSPIEHYKNITVKMPTYSSVVDVDVTKLSGSLQMNPKVVIKDYKS